MQTLYRAIPSVDACLAALAATPFADAPRQQLRELVQMFLDQRRESIRTGQTTDAAALKLPVLLPELLDFVRRGVRPALRRVLNGTGVVIHTNLGRSVLADEAVQASTMAASSYSNLEFDLATGERGSRQSLVEGLICSLTGAEAALVVNNNAAAVLLMLDSLCAGGEVIISRGELVEIGDNFRIPDVMARSGAILKEVGTTNRTHLFDYENALSENTRALLRVHTSNYRITGFHASVKLEDLADLAHTHDLPVLEDLGSGSLIDFTPWGLPGEPTAGEMLAAGADVVTFSGDKVLGGPQAGIIAGKARYVEPVRRNQLLRALRCDKMTLAALEATLRLYLDPGKGLARIPTLRMMTLPQTELKRLAQKLSRVIRKNMPADQAAVTLEPGVSRVGGGAFPEHSLPTTLVRIMPLSFPAEFLRARLLDAEPPLIGRVEHDAFLLDPRCLAEQEFKDVTHALAQAFATGQPALP